MITGYITSTAVFLNFAWNEFLGSGADLLTANRWHGAIMLALVLGDLAFELVFYFIKLSRGSE